MKRSMPWSKVLSCGICKQGFLKDDESVCQCANATCEGTGLCHFKCVLKIVKESPKYDDVTDTSVKAVEERIADSYWNCPVCVLAAPDCAIEGCRNVVGDRICRECDQPLCENHFAIYFRRSQPLWKDEDGNGALMCPACPRYGKTQFRDEEGRPVESAPCK